MFPNYVQLDAKDCGPTCLKIIAKHYGKTISLPELRNISETTRTGSNLKFLARAAETIGLKSLPAKIDFKHLKEAPLPCILHWNNNHFVVLYKIKKDTCYISDPAQGLVSYNKHTFLERWIGANANDHTEEGVVLLLEPTVGFQNDAFSIKETPLNLGFISKYLIRYKPFLVQLGFGLLAGSLLQLIFPFLTQSIVDVGIKNQDMSFIYLILVAQLFLFIGRTAVEVIRSWILLHLSSRINIAMLSDFFVKLMRLPIAFFDTRLTGDILQRINDHERIDKLLTTSSLQVLFSLVNLLVFGLVLIYYDLSIFMVFLIGSLMYLGWILLFLKKRKTLDYEEFEQTADERSKVIELISGMQDIKLHNVEQDFRWDWEHVQARLFKISITRMTWDQYQSIGSSFINELKNILITVLAAKLVIEGSITLGMMLAISYIVGQLNAPIVQLIDFLKDFQDAKISIERLSEIHSKKDETDLKDLPLRELKKSDILLKDVSYRYPGVEVPTLKKLQLTIPKNKVTAIVGSSGSGKTTLMKLLLQFYKPQKGLVKIGNSPLLQLSPGLWRDCCGVVMQEGYIFSNTITRNITMSEADIDQDRLRKAVEMSNIRDFIENLPLSYNTKIGVEGMGLSTGQKQRILIARAIYKNPEYLFFDEATSALDAKNEKEIMENLNTFFKNKTVVIIAHRLSTVKHADQIVVLEEGSIKEIGDHKTLTAQRGRYYELVKNQLELGR
ncbi:ATP-binding cassette subfamily B protein [Seonamhaeicola aphaedonensis]|uniref:ATP-binding cassette subfamily B protein n=1 Tax=Seonamhaeicola aphaedonensis TaxID=1461338 RepID=A0A3D9H844_9FLAO|nr:peptidase domain-containing ABC transporter [Seonamhaeicola aphaedonensis]RED45662.1 ATP-binding cassette subfamily B protein [Seonamhaeicola aphaedonensis]